MLVFFALGNAKVLSFALADAKVPNASSFASQWNIGLIITILGEKHSVMSGGYNVTKPPYLHQQRLPVVSRSALGPEGKP